MENKNFIDAYKGFIDKNIGNFADMVGNLPSKTRKAWEKFLGIFKTPEMGA